jgi:protein-disulfide isomerase
MHFYLRDLIASYPGKIRLVHRNFPMDHTYNPLVKEPFHVGAGKLALLSLYAVGNENFWQFSDMLFEVKASKGRFRIRRIAEAAGYDFKELVRATKDPVIRRKLNIDLRDGLNLGITGTPGYLIEGKLYVGQIPPEIFSRVMK